MILKLSLLFLVLGRVDGAWAQDSPQFVELQSDKSAYTVGETAFLTAHIRIQPENPNFEFFLKGKLGSEVLKINRINENTAFSITPELTVSTQWEVEVFIQDRNFARELRDAIEALEEEIGALQDALAEETDPDKIAHLEEKIAENELILERTEAELESIRTLIETQLLPVEVSP